MRSIWRLRKDLGVYQKHIEDLELLDYRVRVFQGGTDAVTRVLIEFGDASGARWSTVGVSGNIIDASFQALVDAIVYKLVKGRRATSDAKLGTEPPGLFPTGGAAPMLVLPSQGGYGDKRTSE